ncbi:MAG: J domain-containing protein [Polyangia bacterium]|jgi:curved DNA-binding protein CbpA
MSWDDSDESPFAVLGLAPTLDLAAIKRAYFALLTKHPPHQDQEGFKRIRAAYEALGSFGQVAAFLLRHAPDPAVELPTYRERHDAALAQAQRLAAAHAEKAAASTCFAEGLLHIDLDTLLARFGST